MAGVIPDYSARRMSWADARRLCAAADVRIDIGPIMPMGIACPRVAGIQVIYVSEFIPVAARTFVVLHELAHIVAGDVDEPTRAIVDERRYPLRDQVADAVAAIGVTSTRDRQLPPEVLASVLRSLVPVERRAWAVYRSNDVAEVVGGFGLEESDRGASR